MTRPWRRGLAGCCCCDAKANLGLIARSRWGLQNFKVNPLPRHESVVSTKERRGKENGTWDRDSTANKPILGLRATDWSLNQFCVLSYVNKEMIDWLIDWLSINQNPEGQGPKPVTKFLACFQLLLYTYSKTSNLFMNNSVKNQPILVIFGTRIGIFCPPRLNNMSPH